MKVLKQILGRAIQFGGQEHSGWLPANAASPRPTAIENDFLDIRILQTEGGFFLEWQSRNPNRTSDTWHETIKDAEAQAAYQFGIEAWEWKDCVEDS